MTKKQFELAKAAIDADRESIENRKAEIIRGIDERINRLQLKFLTEVPKWFNTVDDCGMTSISFRESELFDGYISIPREKNSYKGRFSISSAHKCNIIDLSYSGDRKSLEEALTDYFNGENWNMMIRMDDYLIKTEQLVKKTNQVQSAIREAAIRYFKDKNAEAAREVERLALK